MRGRNPSAVQVRIPGAGTATPSAPAAIPGSVQSGKSRGLGQSPILKKMTPS